MFFSKKALAIRHRMCYDKFSYGSLRQRTLSGAVVQTEYHKKEETDLPNIKSAKKRVKVTQVKTLQNKMFRTQLKTAMKKYEAAVDAGNTALAQETYKAAVKKIDAAANRGIIHKNAAAHKKSQFTKKLNAMA